MPKGIPITEEELTRRRSEIANTAVQIFTEKGFSETSMREIAEAAGVGKSTIYDYFPSKDEILINFIGEATRQLTVWAEEILAQDLSTAEKIRRIMCKHLEHLLANKQQFLKVTLEAQRLSTDSQKRIQRHRHDYQDLMCDLVQEGIKSSEFRPVNPLLTVRVMLTLLSSAVYTTRPTGSPEEMLLDTLDILFKGMEA